MIPEQHRDMIERRDAERREARQAAELEALALAYYTEASGTDYCHSRNITGVPSNSNRQPKVTESCWTTRSIIVDGHAKRVGRIRAVGGDVKVTRDGETTVVPATSFKRNERSTSRAAAVINEQQARRLRLLAKVDNASDYNN